MERTYVKDIKPGKSILLEGWVHDTRELGKVRFLLLKDMTGIIQVVAHADKCDKKTFELMMSVPRESAIILKGKSKADKKAPGGIEIVPEKIEVVGEAESPIPIDVSDFSKTELSKRLDWRSLSLRMPKSHAIFKIQAKLIEGMQEYLNKHGFLQVFTPCLMGVASESGSEVFEVKYFETKAYLRQDPQLHRQLAILGGIERLYDIGPSWRAEKSNTVKHLTEHRTCAAEMTFIESERDVMRVEEQVIISAFEKVNEECKRELEILGVKLKIPRAPFPEINFPKVYEILRKLGKKIKDGDDLDAEAEKLLWEYVQKEYPGTDFYFVNKFPFAKKPFYVYCDYGEDYARSTDLYYKGMEMSSGGQRENRYDKLIKNVKEKGMPLKSVEWFTKFFRYGAPPHGGFALGIERITMMLLNLENVREAVLFARDPNRLTP